MKFKMNSLSRALAVATAVALVGVGNANAAIDITTATAGITDAGTALLSLLGALIALSASIFGIVKVYGFLKRKSGA